MPQIIADNWIQITTGILASLIPGVLVVGIVYGVMTTQIEVQAQVDEELKSTVKELYSMVVEMKQEAWTQTDQAAYEAERREACAKTLDRIHTKLEKIEEKTHDIIRDHARLTK